MICGWCSLIFIWFVGLFIDNVVTLQNSSLSMSTVLKFLLASISITFSICSFSNSNDFFNQPIVLNHRNWLFFPTCIEREKLYFDSFSDFFLLVHWLNWQSSFFIVTHLVCRYKENVFLALAMTLLPNKLFISLRISTQVLNAYIQFKCCSFWSFTNMWPTNFMTF